ncbi:TPA: hypothetical protein ACLQU7_001494 [Bacillus tropicus]|uniref:hypothetical protein n=1 Tax=Bacillus cereus group TaxID=86661 RepID=UPI0002D4DDAD|nr:MULTISPECIES: hypothetical protein [Bacillus cereus group]AJI07854.1 hypothetical protein AQ16_3514 [Bacillus cereus G9241]EKS7847354.1 hypothetical protein [Bacillus wiedmannii]AIY78164.1 hypothetical protein NT98_920 [Bacillus cereus]ARO20174.1 hypothetical protein B2J90_22945 [Bacillus cereus]KDB43591.1 hypothetical protein DH31_14940 [Bacillus cereus]
MSEAVQLVSQEATVVVHGSSRYNGGKFDEVMVRTTIVTNGPLTENYYVPNGSSLSKEAMALIQNQGLEFRPYRESELLEGTEDVIDVAKAGDVVGTERDIARLLLRSSLVSVPLQQIAQLENGQFVYEVKYEYKLFPVLNDTYEFQIRLPFDGTQIINGSEVKLTVLTPIGGSIDENATKGIDENGQEIQEVVQQLVQTGRSVTTFQYRLDPLFTVRYVHTTPVLSNLINQ